MMRAFVTLDTLRITPLVRSTQRLHELAYRFYEVALAPLKLGDRNVNLLLAGLLSCPAHSCEYVPESRDGVDNDGVSVESIFCVLQRVPHVRASQRYLENL